MLNPLARESGCRYWLLALVSSSHRTCILSCFLNFTEIGLDSENPPTFKNLLYALVNTSQQRFWWVFRSIPRTMESLRFPKTFTVISAVTSMSLRSFSLAEISLSVVQQGVRLFTNYITYILSLPRYSCKTSTSCLVQLLQSLDKRVKYLSCPFETNVSMLPGSK